MTLKKTEMNLELVHADFESRFALFVAETYSNHSRLHEAIRYCLEGVGKRVRAQLAALACDAVGGMTRAALPGAIAIELIHAYSLAHDDLPCMDNDDFRRGRLSLHKRFDEATATLVGDALLTDAFRVVSDDAFFWDARLVGEKQRLDQVRMIAKASGSSGMVYGQELDMFWTKRKSCSLDTLKSIHLQKTGALLGASCAVGAIAGGASKGDVSAFESFGQSIGLAFQAIDDTLDGLKSTGKSAGKDLAQGKLTFLTFMTVKDTVKFAEELTAAALRDLSNRALLSPTMKRFTEQLIFRTS